MKNLSLLLFILIPSLFFTQNRYWVANSASNWSSNNWSASSGGAPDGGGAPVGAQTARFNANGLGNCNVDVAASFNNILIEIGYNGIIDLNGNGFDLNGTGTSRFQDGTINDTPGTSSVNLNNASTVEFIGGSFNAKITGSASTIDFSGSIFNAEVDVDNNSSGGGNGLGGCVFNDNVKITNSGTGNIILGNGSPDVFNGDLELVNTSTSRIRIGYNSVGTEINEDLTISNTGGGVWFGENGGTTIMASSKSINIGVGGFDDNELRFRGFTQLGSTAQSFSLSGTGVLRFQTGTVFNGNVDFDAPRIFLDGASFNGTSDFEKTGASNDANIGGNTFVGNTILRNSGTGYFMLGNVNADTFGGNVTMNNTSNDGMYLGNNSAGNSIGGNLFLNNNPTGSSTVYFASSSISSLAISGDVEIYNNGSSTSQNIYIANEGDVTIGGDLLVENGVTGTANSRQFFLASGSNSSAVISGETTINNAGGNTTSVVYLGNDGDVVFNGDLNINNSATASSSLVYCNHSSTSVNNYNENITLTSSGAGNDGVYFGSSLGSGTLANGKTITIGGAGFTGRYLRLGNFTQLGTTAQSLSLLGTSILEIRSGTIFNGNVDFDAPRIIINSSTFNGTSDIEKTGAVNDGSTGGNTFVGNTILRNSGAGYFLMGNGGVDNFNANLTMFNTGSNNMYIGHNSAGNTIGGNLIVNNNNTANTVYLANGSTSSLAINGDVEVYNNGTSISQGVLIGNNGDLTVGGNLLIENGVTGTANSSSVSVGSGTSSSVIISGTATILNGGGNATSNVFLGNNGDVTFNGDLTILNTSSAGNSYVYCNHGITSSNSYNENITVSSTNAINDGVYFGNGNGSGTLAANKTITIGGAGFIGRYLYLRNFTQIGATSQSLTLTGDTRLELYNSDWGGDLVFEAPTLFTRGSRYRDDVLFTKTGTSGDESEGGNQFDFDFIMNNTGSGTFAMGRTTADSFGNDVIINNSGTGRTRVANNSPGNTIARDLIINNSGSGAYTDVQACVSALASLSINRNCVITNSASSNTGYVYIGNSGTSTSIGGDLFVDNITSGTNGRIYLGNDNVFTLTGDLTINNAGTASNSYVYLANSSSSLVTINGVTSVSNSGTGDNRYVYLGNAGDVTLNDDLSISNSSSAINSRVYCNHTATSSTNYNGDIILESTNANSDGIFFGNGNGTGVLAATKTVSLGGGGFIAGQLYFRNFTQTGNTAHSIVLDPLGTGYFINYDSDWGGDVNFAGPRMNTRGTMYRGSVYLEKTGSIDDRCAGGNTFVGVTELKNTGLDYILMGDGNPDLFQSDLTINNLGEDNMYIAYNSAGNSIAGNLVANLATNGSSSSYLYFSDLSASTLSIAGNVTLNNTSSSTSSYIYFGDDGDVDVQGNFNLINNPTSSNTGDVYISDGSSSTVNIVGNVSAISTGASNNNRLYFYNSGNGTVDGTAFFNNNCSGDRAYIYIANGSTSNVVFNSTLDLFNSGGNTTKQSYIGNQGSITFNGDVQISNNASANSSQVYVNNSASSNNTFNENIVLESYHVNTDGILFGNSNGSATLAASKTVTLGGNGFIAGELRFRNFTQIGATAQTLNLLSTGTGYFLNYDSDWGGNVNFSGPRMNTRGTTYRGTSYLEKTGGLDDSSVGGNTFFGVTELRNTGSRYFLMGNGSPDAFQADLTMNNFGTHYMHLAHSSAGNTIAGDFTVNNNTSGVGAGNIYISNAAASTLSIAGNTVLNNTSSSTNSNIQFGDNGDINVQGTFNIINNQTSSNNGEVRVASRSASTVNLVGDVTISNTGNSANSIVYFYTDGNGTVDGSVSINNNNISSNRAYVYVANSSNSFATLNSTLSIINSGGSTLRQVYVGNQGDLTLNGNVEVSNSATANNSEVYFNYGANSNNLYNENLTFESFGANCDGVQFGRNGGVGTLATGKTISLGANGFTDGLLYFRNFTQLGGTAQTIITTNNSYYQTYNSTWNGNHNFTSPRVYLRQSTFNGSTVLEKTGAVNDASFGANTYNGDVTFRNSGTGYFMPTNNNASDHNGNVTYIKTSTGLMHPTHGSSSTYAGNINIDANSSVNFAGNAGRVIMDGTSAQSINDLGTSPEANFRRLRINNLNNEVTLNTPINVQTELDLINGNIISDATNFITMRDNSVVANVSDNAYVDGPLLKAGNELFVFPVGKVGVYRPIEISAPSSGSAQFKAEFFATDPHLSGYNHGSKDATLDHISNCEYWILDRENTTNNVNVKLYYDSYGPASCSGVDNQAELSVARWDGTTWKDHGNGGVGGTPADGWVTTSGVVTSFSPFTLASTTTNNPLPIELVSFTAKENGNIVDLNWETASEIDNDYFTVERSKDGIVFNSINKVLGAGNSTQNIEYTSIDNNPLNGVSYYRLKQTDFNGEFTYSDIEVVNFSNSSEIVIYPNPVKDLLTIDGLKIDDSIIIYGIDGKLVYSGITSKLDVTEFSSGVYQLVIEHANGTKEVLKFVK